MSIICALHRGGETWIGSDTMCSANGTKLTVGSKWSECGGWWVALAGDLRGHDVIARLALADDAFDAASAIKAALKADGFQGQERTGAENLGQNIMLARAGAVVSIGCDFSLVPIPEGELGAGGSGCDYALGAAWVAGRDTCPTRNVVRLAVDAAIRYDDGCGGDAWTMRIREKDDIDNGKPEQIQPVC